MTTHTPTRTVVPAKHQPDPLDRWPWLTPAIPALVTLVAMVWGLRSTSLWRDEAATITMAKRPWGSFFATLDHIDAVHSLYYLMMRPVVAVFGAGEIAVRIPSVLAMTAAAAFTALLGRRLVSARAGILGGLLLATAFPIITRYTQEARSYPFVTALAVLSTYLFVRAVDRGTTRSFVAYGAALALTGLTHLFSLPLLLIHATALVPLRGDRALLKRWALTAAGVLVIVTPLALKSQGQSAQVDWITKPDWQTLGSLLTWLGGSPLLMLPMLVLVTMGLTVGPGRERVDLRWLLVTWIAIPPLLFISVSLLHPFYLFRYILYCVPPVALLAGIGLARLRLWALMPVGLALLLLSYPAQRSERTISAKADDIRKMARILTKNERPGDAIVFHHHRYRRTMAAYPAAFAHLNDVALGRSAYKIDDLQSSETNAATFEQRLAGVKRLWYVDNATSLHERMDGLKQRLVQRSGTFTLIGKWKFRGGTLYLYERR